jgi:Protein of unknown function (DUF1360)
MIVSRLEDVAIGALCVWRLTHLLHAEDGPFNAAASLRRRAGNSFLGQAMSCFYCLSLWIALPVTLLMNAGVAQFLLLWPTVSGAACLLEQATTRENSPALIYEETKE